MRKDSGFRIQDSGASSALPRDADIAPPADADMAKSAISPASAASLGVRELAPALERPSAGGLRETIALEGGLRETKDLEDGKRHQGAALQSAQGADLAPAAAGTAPTVDQPRRQVCADVTKLEPEWREQVEKLLEEGSSFEDVVEIFEERKGPRVTLHALEVHYQSNLDLQKRRIQHLLKRVDELRRAMSDPNSADAQLANATLFLGLAQLSRRSSRLTIKDAQSLRLQRENLQLRKRVLKMKLAEAERQKSIAHQHYLYEEERRRKLKLENKKLEEILKKLRQDQTLPADVMEKIQEIYGIVKQPFIPPQLAERLPQDETP